MSTIPDLAGIPQVRRDPLGIIIEQNRTRLTQLVGLRMQRMLESPFAFYRGTAAIMASDFSGTPNSGQIVLGCGDAHIANFGFYASPERTLLFDLNDFDEAGFTPWEWDVKRLVTSVFLAARANGVHDDDAVQACRATASAYRGALQHLAGETSVDRYYSAMSTNQLAELADNNSGRALITAIEAKARTRTSDQVLAKLTAVTDGRRRIIDVPPVTEHLDVISDSQMRRIWESYLATTTPDVHYLLQGFTVVDHAMHVVGVGSVGTRCELVLLADSSGTPLFLQVKEAGPTVLATYGGIQQSLHAVDASGVLGNGHRVVACQRVLQAHSDPFLGWMTIDMDAAAAATEALGPEVHRVRNRRGPDAQLSTIDFYWRQFRDMKGSIDLTQLDVAQLTGVAQICAALLARSHSQSPVVHEVAALCAEHPELDDAFAEFARKYADIVDHDFAQLKQAATDGIVPVASEAQPASKGPKPKKAAKPKKAKKTAKPKLAKPGKGTKKATKPKKGSGKKGSGKKGSGKK